MRISDWSSDVCSSDLVDASGRGERRSLNRFLLLLFAVATLATWAWASREFALGLALSALLVAAAMLSARWCKLSLHVAFAMYAAVLLVQLSWLACAAGILFVAAVAWSRLVLDRHAPRDLVRSEEHTSELQSLMRISYAVFCLKKK